jgi:enoyl-CoA hydratase/carnithine racemase
MLFTGAFIDAPTALAWGLVNRLAPPERLDETTVALARQLMDKPRTVIAAGKRFFYDQLERPLADAYRVAAAEITRSMLAEEAREGVGAFVEKRKPSWKT